MELLNIAASKVFGYPPKTILLGSTLKPHKKGASMKQKLTKRFLVNVTEDELKYIDKCVTLSNLSRLQYTRMLYKKVVPKPCPSSELLSFLNIKYVKITTME